VSVVEFCEDGAFHSEGLLPCGACGVPPSS
jgi:hypothetical protein